MRQTLTVSLRDLPLFLEQLLEIREALQDLRVTFDTFLSLEQPHDIELIFSAHYTDSTRLLNLLK